jgi:hypothetical protein
LDFILFWPHADKLLSQLFPTFKYLSTDSSWYLHKDGHKSFHAGDEPEKVETKIKTTRDFGKVPFDKFDIYKDE